MKRLLTLLILLFGLNIQAEIHFPDSNLRLFGPNQGWWIYEEFLMRSPSSYHGYGWNDVEENSGTCSDSSTMSDQNRPGVLSCGTADSATAVAGMELCNEMLELGGGLLVYECSVQVSDLSTADETYTLWIGLGDDELDHDPADGVYFKYTHSLNSGNWSAYTAEASSTTEETGGSNVALVADTWTRLRFEVAADSSTADFYVDGTLIGSSAANVPDDSDKCGISFCIVKSNGTTERKMYVDYLWVCQRFTTNR